MLYAVVLFQWNQFRINLNIRQIFRCLYPYPSILFSSVEWISFRDCTSFKCKLVIVAHLYLGKLTLIVYEGSRSPNTTIEGALRSTSRGQINFTSHNLGVLRLAAFLQKKDDPAVQITKYLRHDVGLIARQGQWIHEEIAFVVRVPDMSTLDTVWDSYLDGTLAMNISMVLIKQKLLPFLTQQTFRQLRTLVVKDEYLMTKNIHMPIEG